jgi:hypothetical protein
LRTGAAFVAGAAWAERRKPKVAREARRAPDLARNPLREVECSLMGDFCNQRHETPPPFATQILTLLGRFLGSIEPWVLIKSEKKADYSS